MNFSSVSIFALDLEHARLKMTSSEEITHGPSLSLSLFFSLALAHTRTHAHTHAHAPIISNSLSQTHIMSSLPPSRIFSSPGQQYPLTRTFLIAEMRSLLHHTSPIHWLIFDKPALNWKLP